MMQICNHCLGRLLAEEGHQVWTYHKGTLSWFMQSTCQSDPPKNPLNCFARKIDSGTSTRACREKVRSVMIVHVLLFSFCFLSDHLLFLLASGQEASQVATESEENRGQEDMGRKEEHSLTQKRKLKMPTLKMWTTLKMWAKRISSRIVLTLSPKQLAQ